MDKELDGKLFAAALHIITEMWSDTMDTLQRASLANQIVREIERRKIVCSATDLEIQQIESVLGKSLQT